MRWTWTTMAWALVALVSGCAADPALQHARQTVALSSQVVEESGTRPVPDEAAPEGRQELRAAVGDAQRQVSDAEQTVEIWQRTGAGRLAWETVAPCLAQKLDELLEAMRAVGIDPPPDMDQAITMARGASSRRCADRSHEGDEPVKRQVDGASTDP